MRVVRIHADAAGVSHLEERRIGLVPDNLGRISQPLAPGQGAFLRELRAGLSVDFHVAPRRQIIFVVGGAVEVEAGDGARASVGAGEAIFVEDLEGRGHLTRVGAEKAMCVYVPVAPDFDIRTVGG